MIVIARWRRRFGGGAVFRYLAGEPVAGMAFSRASAATYTKEQGELQLKYTAGDDLTAYTATRASAATFIQES